MPTSFKLISWKIITKPWDTKFENNSFMLKNPAWGKVKQGEKSSEVFYPCFTDRLGVIPSAVQIKTILEYPLLWSHSSCSEDMKKSKNTFDPSSENTSSPPSAASTSSEIYPKSIYFLPQHLPLCPSTNHLNPRPPWEPAKMLFSLSHLALYNQSILQRVA